MKTEIPDYKKPLWQNDERISKAKWILRELVNDITLRYLAQKSVQNALESNKDQFGKDFDKDEIIETKANLYTYSAILKKIEELSSETHKYQGDY